LIDFLYDVLFVVDLLGDLLYSLLYSLLYNKFTTSRTVRRQQRRCSRGHSWNDIILDAVTVVVQLSGPHHVRQHVVSGTLDRLRTDQRSAGWWTAFGHDPHTD